jgi:GGDEF domain-containing protein
MGSAPPFGSHEDVESALDREMRVPSASLAAMLIDVADVSRFQARLGYASSASLLQSLCDGFSNALGARGRIIRLGDGCFCAIVRSVRNRGHALLAAEKFARTADDLFGAAGDAGRTAAAPRPAGCRGVAQSRLPHRGVRRGL